MGLPQNNDFQNLILEGIHRYGSVYGSSRNGNLQLDIYEEVERKLAAWTGAEAALTLSSGMLAGQAAIRQLMLESFTFFYSPDVHPAVWHLPQVEIPHISFETWVTQSLQRLNNADKKSKIGLVTNSVDALRGQLYDFEWISNIPLSTESEFVVLIDDSHGIGITGIEGRGIMSRIEKHPNVRIIVTASLAKAMGLPGGVILSDTNTLQSIRNSAYFGGCSPIAPNHLYAYCNAGLLYASAYQRLQSNIKTFVSTIQNLQLFSFTEGYPVFYTQHDSLYTFLLERGIFIYSFSYPKPTDKANTRIVISAWHTPEDIQKIGQACHDFALQIK
ncbi:MAG: aminotransferase class I/II-fold pyridoxal phosphate-dependent enzyme [Spirosomataceae bacterium]